MKSALTLAVVALAGLALVSSAPSAPSTSCGSTLLLAQLDRTAKQFPTVKRAVHSFGGSPQAFYEWLQRDAPEG